MEESSPWISVKDKLPESAPYGYLCEMSERVLVRGKNRNQYPWVAHLYVDKSKNYKTYAWGYDLNNVRYTWLNPYRDIRNGQKVTHWMQLPQLPE